MTQMLEANGLNRVKTEITDTTQHIPLTSSPTRHDDLSSSRSPLDSMKHRRPSSMMHAATRGFHALNSSADYSQPVIYNMQ